MRRGLPAARFVLLPWRVRPRRHEGPPHVEHIRGKLWEMRASGNKVEGRALYVAVTGRRVVIVRAFEKTTRKTPLREIALALDRAKEVLK